MNVDRDETRTGAIGGASEIEREREKETVEGSRTREVE